jgi:hypothetical protein
MTGLDWIGDAPARDVARRAAKLALVVLPLAYFFPKFVLFYIACAIYDVSRNSERTPELFDKFFLRDGLPVWLLSPVNALLDLLSLPYVNKGVYKLDDLPPEHQSEIVRLIESARKHDLVGRLQMAASDILGLCRRRRRGAPPFRFGWPLRSARGRRAGGALHPECRRVGRSDEDDRYGRLRREAQAPAPKGCIAVTIMTGCIKRALSGGSSPLQHGPCARARPI